MDLAGDGFVILTLKFSPLSGLEATLFEATLFFSGDFSGDFSSCLSCGYNYISSNFKSHSFEVP